MSDGTLMGGDLGAGKQSGGSDTGHTMDAANTGALDTGNAGSQNGQGSIDQGADSTSNQVVSPEWAANIEGISDLPSDILGDPSLKAIKDVPSLLKSYVHAQKKMGADKVVLPNKNSTNEEWLSFYHKLGLPTEFEQYEVQKPEDSILQEDFYNEFRQKAYENNVLPSQAQALFNFINSKTGEQYSQMEQSQQSKVEEGIKNLKEEWGEAFDQNLFKAKAAVNEFGGEDLKNYLNESGLGNDPNLIKAFAKIGESFLKEDNFQEQGKPAYAMSPAEAQQKANEYMGNFEGPYYNSAHPDHKRVVDEVNKMFQIISGAKGA